MQNNHQNEVHPTVQATPVVVQQHNHWQPREATNDEKRCCCVCTRASVCTFIILMCIGGGALIGVGAAQVARQSDRYSKVDDYNNMVAATEAEYPSGSTPYFASVSNLSVTQPANTPGSVPVFAKPSHHTVTPVDSAFDVKIYDSLVFTAYISNWVENALAEFTVDSTRWTTAQITESVTRLIPPTKLQRDEVKCSIGACVDDCAHYMKCTAASLQSYCEKVYGSDAKYQGDDECRDRDTCGTCSYTAHLERVCVVLEDDISRGFNHHLDSCYYPFHADSQVYGARPAASSGVNRSVKVDFRAAYDPFLAMQRITEGTMSFGHTTEKAASGLMLICIGLALIIVPTCGMCCYRCCCRDQNRRRCSVEDENDDRHGNTSGMVMATSATTVVPAAQDFNQTVPTYPAAGHVVQNSGNGPQNGHHAGPSPVANTKQVVTAGNDMSRGEYGQAEYGQPEPYGMVPDDENRLFGSRGSASSMSGRSQHEADTHVVIEVPDKSKGII